MTDVQLRDKDRVVLQQIQEGRDDVQKITEATTLENHHITYAFQKLEDLELVEVSKPEGMVERVINGQKRVFQAPKKAKLTEKGKEYLEHTEQEDKDEYENLSHRELMEKVHGLEDQMDELERKFEVFRNQILDKIN
ncbi:hypothetical protein [Halorhabdus salina]|uniref:hypothetical protein n=1 Tax=Halorhabdus salina TaxID=2750670 RepID=UPI0015EEF6B7|nr:hypothetical protein [Halorhabdus salina]